MQNSVLLLRQAPPESGGTIETALTTAGLAFRYVDLYHEIPSRLPLDQAAGLVILGGPMNVDEVDRYPFLRHEVPWIREAIEAGLPTLGICLGSQLLAKALGARVYPNHVKEIGWYPIELTPAAAEDPLLAQSGTRTVFQWHGDTFDLPSGAVHLARSPLCENQAFRYGRLSYGLQFHAEMTAAMIDAWVDDLQNGGEPAGLPDVDPDEIRRRTPHELPRMQALAAEIFGRFARMCRKTGQAPSPDSLFAETP